MKEGQTDITEIERRIVLAVLTPLATLLPPFLTQPALDVFKDMLLYIAPLLSCIYCPPQKKTKQTKTMTNIETSDSKRRKPASTKDRHNKVCLINN